MAKQCGSHPFTGKLGATIGYELNGKPLERENGSKEGKAFKKDPRRWRTMYYAGLFAQASKAVVLIYKALPKDQRKHGVYGKLTGKAMSMIKDGRTVEEVKAVLTKQYVENKVPLVVVSEESAKDETSKVTASATGDAVQKQLPTGGSQGQMHVIATVTSPWFSSTASW